MKMWIARDFNGDICLHTERPQLLKTVWHSDVWFFLYENLFPEVTFENSPMEVELKLIEKYMADICGDNRFEIIKKAKAELLNSTNIETSEDEMKVLDNFLFRCWQMDWLERYEKPRDPLDIPTMTADFVKEHGLPCPNGYIFKDENGNVINATKIVLEKKKKEYPKTYVECSDILSVYTDPDIDGYKGELLWTFQKLLICRDAYWKIAGEEMGLGKPWEPSDSDYITGRYCIFVHQGNIICNTPAEDCPLTFPTEEMRDAFKENFDQDIEICKELL